MKRILDKPARQNGRLEGLQEQKEQKQEQAEKEEITNFQKRLCDQLSDLTVRIERLEKRLKLSPSLDQNENREEEEGENTICQKTKNKKHKRQKKKTQTLGHPLWDLFVCGFLVNMNVVRTDRHASPVMVLSLQKQNLVSLRPPTYIIVVNWHLVHSHFMYLFSKIKKSKRSQLVPQVDLQDEAEWGRAFRYIATQSYSLRAAEALTEEQWLQLRQLWSIDLMDAGMEMARFQAAMICIHGNTMESMMAHLYNSKLHTDLSTLWSSHPLMGSKCSLNNLPRELYNAIRQKQQKQEEEDEKLRKAPSALVTQSQCEELLSSGFSGLGMLLQSSTLNRSNPHLQTFPWRTECVVGGCVSLGKKWPFDDVVSLDKSTASDA